MKLKQIEVNNFRQLDNTVLSFQDDITLLAGLDQTTAEKLH
ncbi:MAG: ATP-binding protein [Hungatella sp.]|nr:ATP-binding protein [Hungatella sp.]